MATHTESVSQLQQKVYKLKMDLERAQEEAQFYLSRSIHLEEKLLHIPKQKSTPLISNQFESLAIVDQNNQALKKELDLVKNSLETSQTKLINYQDIIEELHLENEHLTKQLASSKDENQKLTIQLSEALNSNTELQEQMVELKTPFNQLNIRNQELELEVQQLKQENQDLSTILEEKTKNREILIQPVTTKTLAEELSSDSERMRHLEEDNRALTVYINRILTRILETGVVDDVLGSLEE